MKSRNLPGTGHLDQRERDGRLCAGISLREPEVLLAGGGEYAFQIGSVTKQFTAAAVLQEYTFKLMLLSERAQISVPHTATASAPEFSMRLPFNRKA